MALAARTTWPTTCARCGKVQQFEDNWTLGHIKPRRLFEDLQWDPANHQVECWPCNQREGARLASALSRGEIPAQHQLAAAGSSSFAARIAPPARPAPELVRVYARPVDEPDWADPAVDVPLLLSPGDVDLVDALPLPGDEPTVDQPLVQHTGQWVEVTEMATGQRVRLRRSCCGLNHCGCVALQWWPADRVEALPEPDVWAGLGPDD